MALDEENQVSAAINTGEHLLLQAWDSEGKLETLTGKLRELEEGITLSEFPFARDERFGYLSFSPVLAGSGLYLSLTLHLPMLGFLKQIKGLADPLKQRFNCQLKPLSQEGGRNPGNLFVLSNVSSFGLSDEDIAGQLEDAAKQVAEKESVLLEKAFHTGRVTPLVDQAWRAYGTLRYARRLTGIDFLSLWSRMRMGARAGILPVSVDTTNQMLAFASDSRYLTDGADQKTCPFRRADEVRQALSGGEHANFRKI